MEFRVTIGLGQDSIDSAVLEDRATALQDSVTALDQGVGVVVVDLVKAALQLVLAVHADDAVAAARQALHVTGSAVLTAGLNAPASILTLEAEAVPAQPRTTSYAHTPPTAAPNSENTGG